MLILIFLELLISPLVFCLSLLCTFDAIYSWTLPFLVSSCVFFKVFFHFSPLVHPSFQVLVTSILFFSTFQLCLALLFLVYLLHPYLLHLTLSFYLILLFATYLYFPFFICFTTVFFTTFGSSHYPYLWSLFIAILLISSGPCHFRWSLVLWI